MSTAVEKEKVSNIEKKRNLMLNDNMWKTIVLISLPVAITSMVSAIFNLFDAYFSSSIDSSSLAATVFVGPINSVIYAMSGGLGVAATAMIAKSIATKDYAKARKIYGQMLFITLVISALCLFVFQVFTKEVLMLCGASDDLLHNATAYFRITMLALPLKFYSDVYTGQQRAIGNNKKIMILNFISIGVKFILSYILVIQLKFGIEGLGISTLVSTCVLAFFAIYHNFFKKTELKVRIKELTLDFKLMWVLFIFALPIIIEKSTQSFGVLITNKLVVSLGETILSAYGVINKINSIAFGFSTGLGIAIVGIVSQNIAVGNIARIKEAQKKALIIGMGTVVFSLTIIFSLNNWIATLFATNDSGYVDQELIDKILVGMKIYTISVIPWTIMQVYFGIFQGLKKSKYVMIVSVVRLWIFRVGLVWFLLKFTNMGEYAIWYGMLISNTLAMITSFIIYNFVVKKKILNNKEELTLQNSN